MFVIYCKLSSIIVRMRVHESRNPSELFLEVEYILVNYRHLLYIIVKYCPDKSKRIS